MDELEKLLAEEQEKKPEETASGETQTLSKEDEEIKKKQDHLTNLNKAIEEANKRLKDTRKPKLKETEDEELPKIDLTDPSAKAWDNHFNEKVNPVAADVEKAKEEVRRFALREFLTDKPALSKNPEKVKDMMDTYEKLRTSTESTKEGILLDLDKAYAATHYEELLNLAQQSRVNRAMSDALYSDIGVSRGSTSYSSPKEQPIQLDNEARQILSKWGMTPEEYAEMKKKYG